VGVKRSARAMDEATASDDSRALHRNCGTKKLELLIPPQMGPICTCQKRESTHRGGVACI